ncbi:MAG: DNA primase [Sphingomonas sanxanigenens]|uniref:DNA primase n=1 Tax=Sphingomonas sanxanigenens TaxID=397260 RepID=A0A2W5C917_9SPHN|nr:MAG: DNA primase [Sphingomonas sanxanigenens]
MSLSAAFLDELRARTTLSALIGKTVKLQRAGREFRACCPFHNEKTPSFYVNDEKGFYHCFGCSAHGDAIRWLTDQRGLPFMDAVKELAAVAGMEVPAPDPRSAEKAERADTLHGVMAEAQRWFGEQLDGIAGAAARAYLDKRGVTDATRRAFGLGFAPDSRGKLRTALKSAGDPLLVEAGLLIQVEEKEPYDRFRDRLMIPIRDQRGRVIAFGGRIIGQGEPKYLNSPDTPLFDKGRTLYNLDKASAAARKAGRIIVVEGYMDVIALAQAGIGEVVAPLGTALTEAQLERLWRIAEVPILCFDGDGAGQKAAVRAAMRALPLLEPGRSLSFLTLPGGQDPDDLVRAGGPAAFESLLASPEPLVDRLWRHALDEGPLDTPEQRAGLRRRLNDIAQSIGDSDVRQQYQAEFRERFEARFLTRRRNDQRRDFGGRSGRGGNWREPPRPVSTVARSVSTGGIERVLAKGIAAGLLRFPDEIARHMEALTALRFHDPALGRLMAALIDVAIADQTLDPGRLSTILALSEYNDVARELLRADSLPFSFTRRDAEPEKARADLGEAIQVMVSRPEVDAALQEATGRLQARFDEETFAEQQRLLGLRNEVERRLANLMQDGEGDQ